MTAIFERVQKSFERQGMMQHLDARLLKVEQGLVELVLPYSDKVTQQQDGFHGGAMGAVADIAGGYAALTVAPEGSEVVTVEYKINFLGSFKGGELRATGRVVKGGKRIIRILAAPPPDRRQFGGQTVKHRAAWPGKQDKTDEHAEHMPVRGCERLFDGQLRDRGG